MRVLWCAWREYTGDGGAVNRSRVTIDVLRAQREGTEGLMRRQRTRIASLVSHAHGHSRYYRRLYGDASSVNVPLRSLPPVSKPDLMASFDDWVTDPRVTRVGVEEFMSDPSRIGRPYLDRYWVCSTSGTTGYPGLFVHDPQALAVYRAFTIRLDLSWLSGRDWLGVARHRMRWASVIGTGAHFAGASWIEAERNRSWWRRHAFRVFSVQQPLGDLVAALNTFNPGFVSGYPSALEVLAVEQQAGRLRLEPVVLETGGESMLPEDRRRVAQAFGTTPRDVYAASEAITMAFDCTLGWLHVNADWVVLEPVDAENQPTPPGEPSHTVLLTNLANHVQPIIRYDLGDSVLARPDPCPCGSPLPAIRVEGRRDDVLRLENAEGRIVPVLPLAIGSTLDDTPGVRRSQLVQTGGRTIRVRLACDVGADADMAWQRVSESLRCYLGTMGLGNVVLERATEPPEQSERSGKFRQVIGMGRANSV